MVIPGSCRVRGKVKCVRYIVVDGELERGEIEHHRYQHDAVEIQAVTLLQVTRKPRGAGGTVGFADQEFGREPASVAGGIEPDEIADRGNILFKAVPFLGFLAFHGTAVPSADRVDKDQVGLFEQRVFVFRQFEGRRWQVAVILQDYAARAEQSQVQPHRRRARTTVEGKGDGAFRLFIHVVLGIGDKEDLCPRLPGFELLLAVGNLLLHHDRSGEDGVLELFSANGDRVFGLDQLIYRPGLLFFFIVFLFILDFIFFGHESSPVKNMEIV